ncbi:MAG: TRAP transporter small permease subunit [Rhodospirillaceae bacterium]|nr:TRAP transporter small permease subunit [Rhodospirillaceae bacterium]
MAIIARTSDALHWLCRWGALASVLLMVVFIGIQVVARYIWSDPPGWTEEAARYAMVWGGLLGATMAFRLRTDPVLVKLKIFTRPGPRIVADTLRAVAALLFLGPIWFYCIFGPGFDLSRGYIARSMQRTAESIGVPMGWFALALPLAITVIFVHLLAEISGQRRTAAPKPETT